MLFSKSSNDKNCLGIYWGKDAFCLVESTKGQPEKIAYISFDAPIAGDQGQKIPDTIRFTALLQQAIRDKKLLCKKTNLTLSTKDIIYRSFIIPFMQPAEVKNVVDFEATKYIPIKLEDLAYTYHSIPFTDGDQKNLRILFVAAKKNILERYTGILQQAGLETVFIEPASVSLVRLLQKQNQISRQHATGIIEVTQDGGRITVTDKDVIQFVRDFQSTVEGSGTPAENTKFFNDIRVSLNFYQRQNPQGKLDRLTILSENDLTTLATGLGQEFKIPAVSLTIQKILKNAPTNELGILSACGSSLRDNTISSKSFTLSLKSRSATALDTGELFSGWNLKILIPSVILSIAAVVGTLTLTRQNIHESKVKADNLIKSLGIYESSPEDKIIELKNSATSKLEQYRNIRITSEISHYLSKIPKLLPKGAWLSNLSIEYFDGNINKVVIGIDGYVYLPNVDDQIRQVNTIIPKMKADKEFSELFENIVLTNAKKDTFNNYPVTFFHITCK